VGIITLLTDFGTRDWFVPSMKGVILSIVPNAQVVDMTHEIPPQNVRAGSFVLAAAARTFPSGTIHVAVVDPDVGGERKVIAVRTHDYIFLAPDNGLLSFALEHEQIIEMRAIENKKLIRQPVSNTFHGRDVFAPVAAYLANNVEFSSIGPVLDSIHRLKSSKPRVEAAGIHGEVIYVDRFGNLITNMARSFLRAARILGVELGTRRIATVSQSYSDAPPGSAVALINSLDLLEIGIRDGDAAASLGIQIGAPVLVRTRIEV
jgi:hypothetical protein